VVQTIYSASPTDSSGSSSSGSDSSNTGSDSYYEGSGNSLIVEGIGIKMSIAAVLLNVFYVLFG
jgi:hypothetical protein